MDLLNMTCLDGQGVPTDALDSRAFKLKHKLLDHPALSLENLANVIPALSRDHVMYAARKLGVDANFEATFKERPRDQSIEETIENIRTADSYIMVQSPENHSSFQPLYRELMNDVHATMKARGISGEPLDAKLYLFIASPNSVTPFHIDRYSTFLLQFRGSKQVTVFPQWDERIVTAADCEAYVAYSSTKLKYKPELDALATTFSFSPGEALHIPFAAGHHVRNGPGDVSISMSIIFNTPQTRKWIAALRWNHWIRSRGLTPSAVPAGAVRDECKAAAWKAVRTVSNSSAWQAIKRLR